ncbi:MAG: hypothetical protein R3B70_00780 [Polyangiaceae bacterium]
MSMDPESNPIPTAVKELLSLFDGPLSEVRFPDVDGPALRDQVAEVDAAVKEVEAAAAAWAEAKRTVDARLEVLLQKAQRALAYARVYAEDKPELDAQLAGIVVPKWGDPRGTKLTSGESVAARKRGRPRKNEATAPKSQKVITLLPGESTPAEAPASAEAPAPVVVADASSEEPAPVSDVTTSADVETEIEIDADAEVSAAE